MRHLHSGRKLGVNPSHRKAMMRSMTLALIEKESIRTTPPRAKELRWYAERVVTLAKRGDLPSLRRITKILGSTQTKKPGENRVRRALSRLVKDLAPRFKDRAGGYTQIHRLAVHRPGDNAALCVLRYIPAPTTAAKKSTAKTKAAAKTAKDKTKTKSKA